MTNDKLNATGYSAAPDPETTVSPKVVAQAVTGVALTVIVGGIAAITPEHFASLGIWGGVIYGGVVALGSSLAGYIKRDPLRK